jgi:hypothetical protein
LLYFSPLAKRIPSPPLRRARDLYYIYP